MTSFLSEVKNIFRAIQLASAYSLRDYEEWVELHFQAKKIERRASPKINRSHYRLKKHLMRWLRK